MKISRQKMRIRLKTKVKIKSLEKRDANFRELPENGDYICSRLAEILVPKKAMSGSRNCLSTGACTIKLLAALVVVVSH